MPKKRAAAHPEDCARNIKEAVRLVKLYTSGSGDVFALADSKLTAQRADIMRAYCQRDIPFGQCTPAAMLETLSEHANELGAEIDSAAQLASWIGQYAEDKSAAPAAAYDQGQEASQSSTTPASGENNMTAKATKPRAKKASGRKTGKIPVAAKSNAGKPKAATKSGEKRASLIDAAAQVLAKASEPLNCQALVEQAISNGLWTPKAGKTPAATLNSAIHREIKTLGKESRFKLAGRGAFAVK